MKLQYLTALAFALMVSSPAIADGTGQQVGSGEYLKGAQCSLHRTDNKAQVESKVSHPSDSDRDASAAALR